MINKDTLRLPHGSIGQIGAGACSLKQNGSARAGHRIIMNITTSVSRSRRLRPLRGPSLLSDLEIKEIDIPYSCTVKYPIVIGLEQHT